MLIASAEKVGGGAVGFSTRQTNPAESQLLEYMICLGFMTYPLQTSHGGVQPLKSL